MILGRNALEIARSRAKLTEQQEVVIPAKAGIRTVMAYRNVCGRRESDVGLDPRLRGDDSLWIILLVQCPVSDVMRQNCMQRIVGLIKKTHRI